MKRFTSLAAILCLVTLSAAPVGANNLRDHEIRGAWAATWTFTSSTLPFVTPGSGFSAFHMFHAGGTVSSVDDDFFDSTGAGAWEKVGNHQYRFGIHFFVADDSAPGHAAPLVAQVTATIRYDPARDRWSGTFKTALRDRSGMLIGEFAGTVVAARLAV